jgi:hypothetical protein
MFLFLDAIFTVNESSTDYHVTFVEQFPINIHNAPFVFRVNQSLVAFEIKIYPNGTKPEYEDYVCVSIRMLRSQQKIVHLLATFSIRTTDGDWIWPMEKRQKSSLRYMQTYNFTSLASVTNKANKVLDDGGVFTIRMIGSYFIRNQHAITTSAPKLNAKAHTSVDMSYTWTVCNLTLPVVSNWYLESDNFFVGLGVAEFNIIMHPKTTDKNFVSMYIILANIPINCKLPLKVQFTFELIDSNSPEHA